MWRIGSSVFVIATLACGVALAQTAPPDPLQPGAAAIDAPDETAKPAAKAVSKPAPRRAPQKAAASGGLTVTIVNKRYVGLVELDVGPAGGELKKVQGALAFGRRTAVHVDRVKDCLYDIKGRFADEADMDQTGVDLCKDKTINLTDE